MARIRPGGVVLYLYLGTPNPLMKKLAGWSAESQVWMKHYLDMGAAAPLVTRNWQMSCLTRPDTTEQMVVFGVFGPPLGTQDL
jgi:hypothetical protein